jgi:uncharacterized protein (TIGR02246 family)
MKSDEDQIQELVTAWMTASRNGDVNTVLNLMTDDVIFLVPGRAPMRKEEFATVAKAQAREDAAKIDGSSEIQEIKVLGEWAFMWTRLKVVATPSDGSATVERAGYTLTILRKEKGRWLAPVQHAGA